MRRGRFSDASWRSKQRERKRERERERGRGGVVIAEKGTKLMATQRDGHGRSYRSCRA